MARYHPTKNAEPVLAAAKTWIDRCLVGSQSLFSDAPLWDLHTLRELAAAFTDHPDDGDRSFYQKLEDQMRPASSQAKRLMAEMLWALMLVQANISPERKREDIQKVWEWSGDSLDTNHPLLTDATLTGLVNPGASYNTMRWRELNYLIALAIELRQLPAAQQQKIFSDRPTFESWLTAAPMEGNRQFRHILRYLVFPEYNERIISMRDRVTILTAFGRLDPKTLAAMPDHELDDALLELRNELIAKHGTSELDFYGPPLDDMWRPAKVNRAPAAKVPEKMTSGRPPPHRVAEANPPAPHVGSEPSNRIFVGPPGTGKTFQTVPAALALIEPEHPSLAPELDDRDGVKQRFDAYVAQGRIRFVTFHQSFSYEDFIEGLRADHDEKGALRYKVVPGVFKSFCDEARAAPSDSSGRRPNYVLIIDEINRGNLSRVFGELITLIEPDKREGMPEQLSAVLPYSKERFSVPANLHIIATMNTADRSLASMDTALRRRFEFTEIEPSPEELDGIEVDGLEIAELLRCMNLRIELLLDREHRIGHSYFLPLLADPSISALARIFARKVLPLLTEYFFDDWERISWVLNDHRPQTSVPRFVVRQEETPATLLGSALNASMEVRNWRLNPAALNRIESYKGIVERGS